MKLSNCRECSLCKKQDSGFRRTQVVLGRGSPEYRIMFVGEAPGDYDDRNGKLFWPEDPAGEMYDKILKNLSLRREMVYTTTAVKCRPTQVGPAGPKNRPPSGVEIETCRRWLRREIIKQNPKLIVTLGAASLKSVVGVDGVMRHAGRLVDCSEFKCYAFPLLHPASIINDHSRKQQMKKDIVTLRAVIKEVY